MERVWGESCPDCGNREERRQFYRREMERLFVDTDPAKVAQAMSFIGASLNLAQWQPPSLKAIRESLNEVGLRPGRDVTAEELDVLLSAHLTDRRKWELTVSEWADCF